MLSRSLQEQHRRLPPVLAAPLAGKLQRRSFHRRSTPPLHANGWGLAGAVVVTGGAVMAARRQLHSHAVLCEEQKKEAPKSFLNLPDLPPLPRLPALPTLEEIKKKYSLDALSDNLDGWFQHLSSIRTSFQTLQAELERAPGSLYANVVKAAQDIKLHPELEWDAEVRLGTELSRQERAFLRNRKEAMVEAFAKLMDVAAEEVDPRDIPVVAVAGSGGGYRAMVSTLGNLKGAKELGVWDVVSYASAVSGSCWALSLLYSIGGGDMDKAIEHVKHRITVPFLDPSTLELLTKKPTSEYLLAGSILKESSKTGEVSLVDAYGTLVSSRLFIPSTSPLTLDPATLKISSQRTFTDDGSNPLPIYCMIRHEIPMMEDVEAEDVKINKKGASDKEVEAGKAEKSRLVGEGRWMWFECTPYEMGCDEIGAWIPTWSLGRLFENGKNAERLPELSLTIMTGIFASAFCATLYNYFKEVKPVLSTLPYFSTVETWLLGNYQTSLDAIHPFPPAELPNFLKGLSVEDDLREGTPSIVTKLDTLGFMDAGANLNLPYVPLFRRNADIILAFDASADSQDLWFSRAQAYATARELHTWPRVSSALFGPPPSSSDLAASKVDAAKAQEGTTTGSEEHLDADKMESNPQPPPVGSAPSSTQNGQDEGGKMPTSSEGEPPLGRCNIWIGSSVEDDESSCRFDDPSVEDVMARDGIALAYFPLVAGPELENPGEVWSTWKFDYTEDETERLVALSKANFKSGEEQLKKLIRGTWLRKRKQRLDAEEQGKEVV